MSSTNTLEAITRLFTFVYNPSNKSVVPEDVLITGEFDQWKASIPMVKSNGKNGTQFIISIPITIPRKEDCTYFKFIVDGKWQVSSKYNADSTLGEENNFITREELLATAAATRDAPAIPEASGLLATPASQVTTKSFLDTPTSNVDSLSSPGKKKRRIKIKKRIRRNKRTGETVVLSEEVVILGDDESAYSKNIPIDNEENLTTNNTTGLEKDREMHILPIETENHTNTLDPRHPGAGMGPVIVPNPQDIPEFTQIKDVDGDALNKHINDELRAEKEQEKRRSVGDNSRNIVIPSNSNEIPEFSQVRDVDGDELNEHINRELRQGKNRSSFREEIKPAEKTRGVNEDLKNIVIPTNANEIPAFFQVRDVDSTELNEQINNDYNLKNTLQSKNAKNDETYGSKFIENTNLDNQIKSPTSSTRSDSKDIATPIANKRYSADNTVTPNISRSNTSNKDDKEKMTSYSHTPSKKNKSLSRSSSSRENRLSSDETSNRYDSAVPVKSKTHSLKRESHHSHSANAHENILTPEQSYDEDELSVFPDSIREVDSNVDSLGVSRISTRDQPNRKGKHDDPAAMIRKNMVDNVNQQPTHQKHHTVKPTHSHKSHSSNHREILAAGATAAGGGIAATALGDNAELFHKPSFPSTDTGSKEVESVVTKGTDEIYDVKRASVIDADSGNNKSTEHFKAATPAYDSTNVPTTPKSGNYGFDSTKEKSRPTSQKRTSVISSIKDKQINESNANDIKGTTTPTSGTKKTGAFSGIMNSIRSTRDSISIKSEKSKKSSTSKRSKNRDSKQIKHNPFRDGSAKEITKKSSNGEPTTPSRSLDPKSRESSKPDNLDKILAQSRNGTPKNVKSTPKATNLESSPSIVGAKELSTPSKNNASNNIDAEIPIEGKVKQSSPTAINTQSVTSKNKNTPKRTMVDETSPVAKENTSTEPVSTKKSISSPVEPVSTKKSVSSPVIDSPKTNTSPNKKPSISRKQSTSSHKGHHPVNKEKTSTRKTSTSSKKESAATLGESAHTSKKMPDVPKRPASKDRKKSKSSEVPTVESQASKSKSRDIDERLPTYVSRPELGTKKKSTRSERAATPVEEERTERKLDTTIVDDSSDEETTIFRDATGSLPADRVENYDSLYPDNASRVLADIYEPSGEIKGLDHTNEPSENATRELIIGKDTTKSTTPIAHDPNFGTNVGVPATEKDVSATPITPIVSKEEDPKPKTHKSSSKAKKVKENEKRTSKRTSKSNGRSTVPKAAANTTTTPAKKENKSFFSSLCCF